MEKSQQQQRTTHMPYSMKKRPKKRDRKDQGSNGGQETTRTAKTSTAASSRDEQPEPQQPLSALSPSTLGICPLVSSRYVKMGGRVGEGTYGVVYQALDKVTNRKVALKRCIPHHESSDGFPLTTLREIHTLKVCCQHPNIVDLLEIAVNDNTSLDSKGNPRGGVFLVFEYCPTDLANILDTYAAEQLNHKKRSKSYHASRQQSHSPFSEAQVKTLTHQLLSAIDCCHSHFLIHRDIKPSNLLYTSDGVLKLCDFGLSRHCSGRADQPPLTPNVVSLWYRAPELLFKKARGNTTASSYSFPIDLFAVGCVFCEFLQGYPLLDGKTELGQMDKMVQCLGEPPSRLYQYRPSQVSWSSSSKSTTAALWDRFEYLSTEGLSLMTRLLEYDPGERWTASQALQSDYFTTGPLPTTRMPSLRELGVGN